MSESSPIVLLTDFGTRDAYAASIKGVIATLSPHVSVIDLTHEIGPQNVRQAAFVLEAAYPYFPKGSIFVNVVDPGVGGQRRILAAKTKRGIFLAPDNGLLTRVLERERSHELREVTNRKFFLKTVSATFHGRDCFAPTAARLAKNPALFSKLGAKVSSFRRIHFAAPEKRTGRVRGEIIYFDHFGNAFTNLTKDFLERTNGKSPLTVRVNGKDIGRIRRSYFEVSPAGAVAVFSSTGILEIAVNQGSAKEKLKLKEGTPVEVFKA